MLKDILQIALPSRRWLLPAVAFVIAAGVATPLVARAATVDVWNLGAQVTDLRIGPSDEVWVMKGGAPAKLEPATNTLTTYSHPLAGQDVLAVDGSGMVWSPDSFSPPTTYVISRLDPNPESLQVTSWPVDMWGVANSIAVDGSNNVWWAGNYGGRGEYQAVWRLAPATNTISRWTLPISSPEIGSHPFDSSGRVWLRYSGGVAVLDPGTSYLTYWALSGSQYPFAHTDGKVWFARQLSGVDTIARLDPSANPSPLTEWPCRAGCDGLGHLYVERVGSVDHVWFTESPGSYIGRLNTGASPPEFSEWPITCAGVYGATCSPAAVAPDPRAVEFDSGGNVWMYFGESLYNHYRKVARLTTP
jgi:streptogramin lyase